MTRITNTKATITHASALNAPFASNHIPQDEMLDYLKARNIDDDLATFICMYADQKEQTEYMNWLQEVDSFVK